MIEEITLLDRPRLLFAIDLENVLKKFEDNNKIRIDTLNIIFDPKKDQYKVQFTTKDKKEELNNE